MIAATKLNSLTGATGELIVSRWEPDGQDALAAAQSAKFVSIHNRHESTPSEPSSVYRDQPPVHVGDGVVRLW